ncbi:MAG: acetoacetate decarboxylase family protein [Actinobacteria bacterium]|nr:acetoacetate decarboxylase family protein [Actinomycetota bacterium]MBU1943609.1 acetoacetate decarboxylase family protein [Actinomycetota bacterium]MBU2688942.1 acetoacetate decarboxylase family protein [Actinomycetota bacterium]
MSQEEWLPVGTPMPFEPGGRFKAAGVRSSFVDPGRALAGEARIVLADIPVDGREAQRLLPLGLRMQDPPMARVFVVNYGNAVYTESYNEASVILRVRSLLGSGGHVCWMVVDDDTALILGRDLLACPKKLADIRYEESDGGVSAGVTRRGTKVLSIEAEIMEAEPSPAPVYGEKAFNVGGPCQALLFNPVWCFRLGEVIHSSHSARGTITFEESAYDPLAAVVGRREVDGPLRVAHVDINRLCYMFPVGIAGPAWAMRTYDLRFH